MENEKYLSNKLRKAIEDSGFTDDILAGMYDVIKDMDDEELKEYIYTNAQYYKQNIPMAVKDIPELKALVYTEPNWGEQPSSFTKLFGNEDISEEDFLRNFDKIPYDQIEYVAAAHGMDPKKLEKVIRERQTQQNRKDIAEGYGETGFDKFRTKLAGFMFPSMMKGVYEGRDPKGSEIAQDVITNGAYAVPWNRVIGGVGKVATASPFTRGLLTEGVGNVIAPAAQEGADIVFGDEDKTAGERLSNIGFGTLVNWGAPRVMERIPGMKTANELIGRETARDIVTKQAQKEAKVLELFNKAKKKLEMVGGDVEKLTPQEKNILFGADNLADILATGSTYNKMEQDVARQTGETFAQKLAKAPKNTREFVESLSPKEREAFVKAVETNWNMTFNLPGTMTQSLLQSGQSYGTNRFGDWFYQDNPASIRGVGTLLNKAGLVETKQEKEKRERQERREKKKAEAEQKYKGKYTKEMIDDSDRQRQWESGFKPNKIEGDPLWESYTRWYLKKYGEMPR